MGKIISLIGLLLIQGIARAESPASQPDLSSRPFEKDGLQVTVSPCPKSTFPVNEPLEFTVLFKNVSDKPFNLLSADGYHYRQWQLRFGKQPQGEGGWGVFGFNQAGTPKPTVVQLEPGRSLTVPIVLKGMDLKGVARVLSGGKQEQLNPAKYLLSVKIDQHDNAENDPNPAVRYWAGQIITEPLEFEITDRPATGPATQPVVTGTVMDAAGKPVEGAAITVSMRDGPTRSFTAATAKTEANGGFSIPLSPGEFDYLAVIHGDQTARTESFILRSGQKLHLGVLRLAPIAPPAPPPIRGPQ